jgi:hypothetical protein
MRLARRVPKSWGSVEGPAGDSGKTSCRDAEDRARARTRPSGRGGKKAILRPHRRSCEHEDLDGVRQADQRAEQGGTRNRREQSAEHLRASSESFVRRGSTDGIPENPHWASFSKPKSDTSRPPDTKLEKYSLRMLSTLNSKYEGRDMRDVSRRSRSRNPFVTMPHNWLSLLLRYSCTSACGLKRRACERLSRSARKPSI